MKHNDLKRLLKTIQFRTEKTIEEIAVEIGYARAYLTDQVNKGTNDTIRKVLTEKYGKYLEQNVSYNTPVNSLQPPDGHKSSKSSKDADIVQTATTKPDYGMKATNGTNGKDHTISQLVSNETKLIDTNKNQQETIGKLTDLVTKLVEKR